ncbi:hypothetical protein [uncultured Tateyamaria sp.]|uniref:hypothetical protein n=1 Tax=Tateyamaria sp. 1078 TaxID=3417464 RepID=UPI00262567C2|nr:hypothetical protein [uncultured Tateyamaria sp.]
MIRAAAFSGLLAALPFEAAAHQMIVFASVNCEAVLVEAKFSNGNAVQQADVRVLDGDNRLQSTLPIQTDGTVSVPLDSVDHTGGLVIEVDTGSHDNYWIVTPEDIAKNCQS